MLNDLEVEQWQVAADRMVKLAVLLAERPGVIDPNELPNWLRMTAGECDRQGNYGAAKLLEIWAEQVEDMES